jgi:plastocyanin
VRFGSYVPSSARAAALALLLSACGSAAAASPIATTSVDLPPSYLFSPSAITVKAGSTVTWTNHDNFTHSVELLDGSGKLVGIMHPGESVHWIFAKAGLYHYECTFHPQNMQGTVTVTAS